jgi:signal transduction histidine kinase
MRPLGSTAVARPRQWWRRRSLRARLTAASTTVIALGMVAAAVLLVWRVHSASVNGVDGQLAQRVRDVAAEVAQGQTGVVRASGADSAILVQVVSVDGQLVANSANIEGEPALFSFPAVGGVVTTHQVDTSGAGSEQGTFLVAAMTAPSPAGPTTVYAARSTSDINQSTTEIVAALLSGVPVLVALLGAVGWVLVGRALRPVEVMRRQVSAIPGATVHERITVGAADDELQRLAGTFNDLLDRIQATTEQQRRFLADAAHELRNPVAALRTRLDVRTSHPELPLSAADRADLADDVGRLASLVDALLSLARLDAHSALRRRPVDLDDLVFDHAHRLGRTAGVTLDVAGVSGAQVVGDPAALDRVVGNLLDNAVRHAATTVWVSLDADTAGTTLVVADDGAGIPEADRQRVFDRFTRLDDPRSRDRGGAGLGLSIVREVVQAHGGTVTIAENAPGAVFVVVLPAGGAPAT